MRSATRDKVGKDPAYLHWIHGFLCVVCFRSGWLEALELGDLSLMGREHNFYSRRDHGTEAAHFGPRGLSQKAPDRRTLPLCINHHREGKDAAHKLGRRFEQHHEINVEAIMNALNRMYAVTIP